MKKLIAFLLVAVLGVAGISHASLRETAAEASRAAEPVYKVSYPIIGGEDVMPVGVWWGPYRSEGAYINGQRLPNYISDEYFSLLEESGANFITVSPTTFGDSAETIYQSLDLCQKYGLGYFVYDTWLYNEANIPDMASRLQNYIYHPACIGIHMQDEPRMTDFDSIARIVNAYNALGFDKKDAYINLLPSYGTVFSGSEFEQIPYSEYVDTFLQKVDVPFLSYDYYPFLEPNRGITNMRSYFQNLSLIREKANEYEIPFWVFVQTGGQWNESGAQATVELFPSEYEFLWNVNTCLAYGAKGIQYFTYLQPSDYTETPDGTKDYEKNGMIGEAGNINRWYYYAQKANKQIAAVDRVLMNAASMGILTVGDEADRNITGSEKLSSFRELESISANDLIVGCFDYGGKTAFYIVSNDIENKQNITLRFNGRYSYEVIQRAVSATVSGNSLSLTIERGEGILVVVEN